MTRLVAPAKLTTKLRISGVRDDGFHLLEAEMVSLDLADVLEVAELTKGGVAGVGADGGGVVEGPGVTYVGPHAAAVPAEGDLVSGALAMVNRAARVTVDKQIPAGGGLGGGSSDAAAILRWAGFTDLAAAARLGADVAFCVVGGRARVAGIGEIVEPLPFEPKTFTLVLPPFGCSTPAVYRRWDEMGGPRGDGGNDLEPAALSYEPRLAQWRDRLAQATGQTPRLAGSGSTWFVEGAFPGGGRIVTATTAAAAGG